MTIIDLIEMIKEYNNTYAHIYEDLTITAVIGAPASMYMRLEHIDDEFDVRFETGIDELTPECVHRKFLKCLSWYEEFRRNNIDS